MRRARSPLTAWRRLAVAVSAAVLLAPVPAASDTCVGLKLESGPMAFTPGPPSAMAVGDYDRDGELDAVVANGTSSLAVLKGDGSGGLSELTTLTTVANPVDVVSGDLDRDGWPDLVVASGTDGEVFAHQGLPGDFSPGASTTVGIVPTRVALADFDRDGRLDLVVVSQTSHRILVLQGTGSLGFGPVLADLDLAATTPGPVAPVAADLDGDGDTDLAVTLTSPSGAVAVFLGDGLGTLTPRPPIGVGANPLDLVAGDLDRDGLLDLVTADADAGKASVLRGIGGGDFAPQTPVTWVGGARPTRVALADLDRDAILDLAVLDETGGANPRLSAFEGTAALPDLFGTTSYDVDLVAGAAPLGLVVADFTSDGRPDLLTATASTSQVLVAKNGSGVSCTRTAFAGAPRAWAAGDGPASVAVADFDEADPRSDLVVASVFDGKIQLLRASGTGFAPPLPTTVSPPARGVATADFDFDGHADVVAALGDAAQGRVQILKGDGTGALVLGASRSAGINTAAVAVGDFDGNGAPDVAAVSEGDGKVLVFLGDGAGGLAPAIEVRTGMNAPRALLVAELTGDGRVDLVAAASGGNTVEVFRNDGGGSFTGIGVHGVGSGPSGLAAADLDADGKTDLVTADNLAARISVLKGTGSGGFAAAVPTPVNGSPTAVRILDFTGSTAPDIAVTASGTALLNLFQNDGTGSLTALAPHPLRASPQAIALVDADADGLADLAIPCRAADAVVVVLARPPGFESAPRVGAGTQPRDVAAADLDGDGDLDLAVASELDDKITLLRNEGGSFAAFPTPDPAVSTRPVSIVAADFDRNGRVDLAASAPGRVPAAVAVLLANGPGSFADAVYVDVGTTPDALAAGDFDRDGDLDLAVCDLVGGGSVRILENDGGGSFTQGGSATVGNKPTAIVAVDLDQDGILDLAVANETSNDISLLEGNGNLTFEARGTLALVSGDTAPVALAAGDFDGDGVPDLAAGSFSADRISVFRNQGGFSFATPGGFASPNLVSDLAVADLNLDGHPDLAVAAGGLSVLRGKGGIDFEVPETVVTAREPRALAVGDYDRDGWPDAAVVNNTDDVSILLSTSCRPRRLGASIVLSVSTCTGAAPYPVSATVQLLDDGGNPAVCAAGTVTAEIVPGTGGLSGTTSKPLVPDTGAVSFTDLTVSNPGRRYRLQFSAAGLPPAVSRTFTLGAQLAIVGPPSVCPGASGVFGTEGSYDAYAWTLDAAPLAFTPTVTLVNPPLALGSHTLEVSTRVDGCSASANRDVYAGDLQSTTLDLVGVDTVCVDCIGGTIKAVDLGGGVPLSRQWGYRMVSGVGNPITAMPGEVGELYVIKGSSFPGPGTYHVVVTTVPTCGSATVSAERAVTVIAPVPGGEVQQLAASARGSSATLGEVQLQWVNSTGAADEVRVRWNKAPDLSSVCVPPPDTLAPATDEASISSPSQGTRDGFSHSGLVFDTAYCYSVFVRVGTFWSPGRTVKARPFNADLGPVKWAYSTGATAVVPPVVGQDAILLMSNDRTVHALTRGAAGGGQWPPDPWVPRSLTGVAHSRSPIVPFGPASTVFPGSSVLFAADDLGDVHAFDARSGSPKWVPPATPSATATVTGAPGAMLKQYGGVRDLVLVGTRNTNSANPSDFFGLDVATGATLAAFNGAGTMGPVSGSPAVDYANQRVYFASRKHLGAGDTVWALTVSAGPPPFSLAWSRDYGEFDTSPVLRNGRIYVGNTAGLVHSIDAATGDDLRTFTPTPLDGPVKGFVFPDRRNDDIIFATNTKVWSVSDDGTAAMTKNWEWTVAGLNPSIVLYWPQTYYVYVGSKDGKLYQLDFQNANPSTPPVSAPPLVLGDGAGQVGAPTLDIGVDLGGGKRLLIVGSESGVVYGVEVPF